MSTLGDVWSRFVRTPRQLCLDLRARADFEAGHVKHAVWIDGLPALKTRFSTLPPRGAPFLVVCDAWHAGDVARAFVPPERWAIVAVVGVGDAHDSQPACHPLLYTPVTELAHHAASSGLWATQDDAPALLFEPAPVVRRVVDFLLPRPALSILDLGCGAGRDVTYALVHARAASRSWRAVCVDRWRAALDRAAQLLADHNLMPPSRSSSLCDGVCACDVLDDGRVREAHAEPVPFRAWAASLPHAEYDTVWLIRFWPRGILPVLPTIVVPHGLIVLSHFVQEPDAAIPTRGTPLSTYDSPPIDKRIQPGEVRSLLSQWSQHGPCQVLDECIECVEDGRPVHSLVVRVKCHPA